MTLFQTDEIIDTRVAEVVAEMKFPRDAPKPRVMKASGALSQIIFMHTYKYTLMVSPPYV